MTRRSALTVLGLALTLSSCAAGSTAPPPSESATTRPSGTVVAASCDDGLRPIREYMVSHDEPLTAEAKEAVRAMASDAYLVCSPTEFRAFADAELMPWAERVGDAEAG